MKRALSLFMILFLGLAAPAFGEGPVTLRPTTELRGETVRLSDVFTGVPAAIDREIARAPAPGASVTYDVRILANLAETYRLDWRPESMADKAVLIRAATIITPDMIRSAVIAKLTADDTPNKVEGRPEIDFDGRDPEIKIPADHAPDFTLSAFTYDPSQKRFRADLRAETGRAPLMLVVSGRVTVWREVPVLAHRLDAGVTISNGDLDFVSLPDTRLSGDVISEADQLIGQALRREGQPNQPLRAHDIVPPRLVARGDIVTLKVETPWMLITAQGRALQDGAKGEVIRVVNTQSNRTVEGSIEATGIVRIRTGAQRVAQTETEPVSPKSLDKAVP